MVSRLCKLRRVPAVHFVLLGAALFFLQTRVLTPAGSSASVPSREPIVVSTERIEQIRSDYQRASGRAPSTEVVQALIDDWVTNELLYREALALGLDRADRSIKWRLSEKMRFLGERPEASPDDLYREALKLGLDRDDIVVRRILVQKMRLLTKTAVTKASLSDSDVHQFFTEHQDDYMQPARITLSQVFFSNERRGDAAEGDAQRLRQELRSHPTSTTDAVERGDPFPLGHDYRASSVQYLQKIFGADFAKQVFALPVKEWSGPIRSAYGLHLIWVDEIEPEKAPPFDVVRSRVEQRLLSERRDKHLKETVQRLRREYGVRIEGSV